MHAGLVAEGQDGLEGSVSSVDLPGRTRNDLLVAPAALGRPRTSQSSGHPGRLLRTDESKSNPHVKSDGRDKFRGLSEEWIPDSNASHGEVARNIASDALKCADYITCL